MKNEGTKQRKKPHRHRPQYRDYQRERGYGEVEEDKGGINGDRRRIDLGR